MNILKLAREADILTIDHHYLERFATLVRAQTLEEAAGVCERLPMQQEIDVRDECAAAAIRQLKDKT